MHKEPDDPEELWVCCLMPRELAGQRSHVSEHALDQAAIAGLLRELGGGVCPEVVAVRPVGAPPLRGPPGSAARLARTGRGLGGGGEGVAALQHAHHAAPVHVSHGQQLLCAGWGWGEGEGEEGEE